MLSQGLNSCRGDVGAEVDGKNTQLVTFAKLLETSVSDRVLEVVRPELFEVELVF